MADESAPDIPHRVLDVLRTFLAANSRGEQAVLVLETRNCTLTTKYRNVETAAGAPAPPPMNRKKVNPARARRSRLRLEEFIKKKVENKKRAGDSASDKMKPIVKDNMGDNMVDTAKKINKLVIKIDKEKEEVPLVKDLASPIQQVDGAGEKMKLAYSFQSEYGEEDIVYTLSEIFQESTVANLVSRKRINPRSAVHQCIVELDLEADKKEDFSWPALKPWQKDTFLELKRIWK